MVGRIPIVAVGVPAWGLRGGWRDYCIVNAPERSGSCRSSRTLELRGELELRGDVWLGIAGTSENAPLYSDLGHCGKAHLWATLCSKHECDNCKQAGAAAHSCKKTEKTIKNSPAQR